MVITSRTTPFPFPSLPISPSSHTPAMNTMQSRHSDQLSVIKVHERGRSGRGNHGPFDISTSKPGMYRSPDFAPIETCLHQLPATVPKPPTKPSHPWAPSIVKSMDVNMSVLLPEINSVPSQGSPGQGSQSQGSPGQALANTPPIGNNVVFPSPIPNVLHTGKPCYSGGRGGFRGAYLRRPEIWRNGKPSEISSKNLIKHHGGDDHDDVDESAKRHEVVHKENTHFKHVPQYAWRLVKTSNPRGTTKYPKDILRLKEQGDETQEGSCFSTSEGLGNINHYNITPSLGLALRRYGFLKKLIPPTEHNTSLVEVIDMDNLHPNDPQGQPLPPIGPDSDEEEMEKDNEITQGCDFLSEGTGEEKKAQNFPIKGILTRQIKHCNHRRSKGKKSTKKVKFCDTAQTRYYGSDDDEIYDEKTPVKEDAIGKSSPEKLVPTQDLSSSLKHSKSPPVVPGNSLFGCKTSNILSGLSQKEIFKMAAKPLVGNYTGVIAFPKRQRQTVNISYDPYESYRRTH